MFKRLVLFVAFLCVCVGVNTLAHVQAAGCSVDSFTASTGGPVTVGDTVTFNRSAHCDGVGLRAIRQTFNGNPWGEYGGPSDSRTWNTGAEFGAGSYHICLQVAESGNDSWDGVAQSCLDITVNPAAPPPAQIPQCSISVNPSGNIVVPANSPVNVSVNANCDTGVRAVRVLLNDAVQQDNMPAQSSWTWGGSGPSNTLWRICGQVSGNGDDNWSYKQESCFTVQVQDQGHPVVTLAPPVGSTSAPNQPDQPTSMPNVPVSTLVPTVPPQPTAMPVPYVGYQEIPAGDTRTFITPIGQDGLNVRNAQNTDPSSLIARLPFGDYLVLISTDNGWYRASWANGEGWVTARTDLSQLVNTQVAPTNPPVPTVQTITTIGSNTLPNDGNSYVTPVVSQGLFVYGIPNTQAVAVGFLPFGNYAQLTITVTIDEKVWSKVSWQNVTGWLDGDPAQSQVIGKPILGVTSVPITMTPAPEFPEGKEPDGGLNMLLFCQHWGWNTEQHSDSGLDVAYEHRCVTNQQVKKLTLDDFNIACKQAYGWQYHSQLLNPDDAAGWKCVPDQNALIATPNGVDPRATTAVPPTPVPVVLPPTGGGTIYNCPASMIPHLVSGGQGQVTDVQMGVYVNPKVTSSISVLMNQGAVFNVTSGSNCQDGVNWFQVSYNGTSGWIPEGYGGKYYVEPYSATPPPQVETMSCDGSGDTFAPVSSWIPQVVAAMGPQCTDLVRDTYKGLGDYCPSVNGVAGYWDDKARTPDGVKCGLTVNPVNANTQPNRFDIRVDDIVVWDPFCGQPGAQSGQFGHVGIVTSVNLNLNSAGPAFMDTITVWEQNFPTGSPPHSRTLLVDACLNFIHVPQYMKNPKAK